MRKPTEQKTIFEVSIFDKGWILEYVKILRNKDSKKITLYKMCLPSEDRIHKREMIP